MSQMPISKDNWIVIAGNKIIGPLSQKKALEIYNLHKSKNQSYTVTVCEIYLQSKKV